MLGQRRRRLASIISALGQHFFIWWDVHCGHTARHVDKLSVFLADFSVNSQPIVNNIKKSRLIQTAVQTKTLEILSRSISQVLLTCNVWCSVFIEGRQIFQFNAWQIQLLKYRS